MNTVILNDDYIEACWEGHQDLASVQKINEELVAAASQLKAQDKPVLLLISAHNSVDKFHFSLFKETLKVLERVSLNRAAIYGEVPGVIITLANTIVHSFSHDFDMKHFPDKAQALFWLREYNAPKSQPSPV